jgi:hypothetical protein
VVDLGENALGGQGEHEAGLNSGASVTYSGLLYARGFDMYMHTWSQEITGPGADLVRADIIAVGIPEERKRGTAHRASLAVLEQRFELALPRDLVLGASLPTALVRGQQPR